MPEKLPFNTLRSESHSRRTYGTGSKLQAGPEDLGRNGRCRAAAKIGIKMRKLKQIVTTTSTYTAYDYKDVHATN